MSWAMASRDIAVASAPVLAVDVPRAAEMIGANEGDVRRWITDGILPVVRYPSTRRPGEPSRRILIAVSDLQAFIERHRESSPAPNAALSGAAVRRWRERDDEIRKRATGRAEQVS
jgi:hypothetical protein